MSFWRFGFTPVSSISTLLSSSSPPLSILSSLLDEDDLLQELKTSNPKLLEFVSRRDVALRLLQWVTEGFGSEEDAGVKVDERKLLLDFVKGGKEETKWSREKEKEEERWRRVGVGEGGRVDDEWRKRRFKFPYVATEILCMDLFPLLETIFSAPQSFLLPFWNSVMSRTPGELSLKTVQVGYFVKVMGSFLQARPVQTLTFIYALPSFLPRILSHLPTCSPLSDLVLRLLYLDLNPQLPPHLSPSLFLERERLIPQLLDLIHPSRPTGHHQAASELIKILISFENGMVSGNVVEILGLGVGLGGIAALGGGAMGMGKPGGNEAQALGLGRGVMQSPFGLLGASGILQCKPGERVRWPEFRFCRELVRADTIRRMLDTVLPPKRKREESNKADDRLNDSTFALSSSLGGTSASEEFTNISTPDVAPSEGVGEPSVLLEQSESGEIFGISPPELASNLGPFQQIASVHRKEDSSPTPSPQLAPTQSDIDGNNVTSSLIHILSLIIDLIRKNNSDFVEQQILAWAQREEAADRAKEENGGNGDVDGVKEEDWRDPKGPSVVDLTHLLKALTERVEDFQELLRNPRSGKESMPSTIGDIKPLTVERFRICELYAELVHCSNMSLLNRADGPQYDEEGHLVGGYHAAEKLNLAIRGAMQENDYTEPVPVVDQAEGETPVVVNGASLPRLSSDMEDVPLDSPAAERSQSKAFVAGKSGDSSPAEKTEEGSSVDSESGGILDREEAQAVQSLVNGTETPNDEDDEEDPFDDTRAIREEFDALTINGDHPPIEDAIERPHHRFLPSSTPITQSSETLPTGDVLKETFMQQRVLSTILDLFFDYPWNNFLHNAVYDIFQQIFGGHMDRGLNRKLTVEAFTVADITGRILDGEERNTNVLSQDKGVRLGYMGHMSIMAEEVVKLFQHYPYEIFDVVSSSLRQPEWDRYVNDVLKPSRELDSQPLGVNGMSIMHDNTSFASNGVDEDDFSITRNGKGHGTELDTGGDGRKDNPASDQFTRYLVQQISSDLPDKFASDDDEDDSHHWLSTSTFDPNDVDYELNESKVKTNKARHSFVQTSSDSEEEADWGFTSKSSKPSTSKIEESNLFAGDSFQPLASTSSNKVTDISSSSSAKLDWGTDFSTGVSSNPFGDDDDEFGNFMDATSPATNSNAFGDFDFSESQAFSEFGSDFAPTISQKFDIPPSPPPPPTSESPSNSRVNPTSSTTEQVKTSQADITPSPVAVPAPPLPSSPPDTLSVDPSTFRTPPVRPGTPEVRSPLSPILDMRRSGHSRTPSSTGSAHSPKPTILAISPTEPLGPGVTKSAHLTEDGMVEAMVGGVPVKVPADDIALEVALEREENLSHSSHISSSPVLSGEKDKS
ncbi:SAPS-domain-containing protein [Atractiella rhizophila]|nr:SAPS-domain-containing protein [Atractiella rhizophila]